jgi:hypothetical protein
VSETDIRGRRHLVGDSFFLLPPLALLMLLNGNVFYCPACLIVQSACIETDRLSIQPFLDFSVRVQCAEYSQSIAVILREMMFYSDRIGSIDAVMSSAAMTSLRN